MTDDANRLKADNSINGLPCAWCAEAIVFGEDVASCRACRTNHHDECWSAHGGCAAVGCVNEPLEDDVVAEEVHVETIECPHCGALIDATLRVCPGCHQEPIADGIHSGPPRKAPTAATAMWCGLIGLLCCGIILGPIAIIKANEAKTLIERDPSYTGLGQAQTGFVLGIIATVLSIAGFLIQLA